MYCIQWQHKPLWQYHGHQNEELNAAREKIAKLKKTLKGVFLNIDMLEADDGHKTSDKVAERKREYDERTRD